MIHPSDSFLYQQFKQVAFGFAKIDFKRDACYIGMNYCEIRFRLVSELFACSCHFNEMTYTWVKVNLTSIIS